MEIKKPLPLGVEDFEEVRKGCYYVDKTLLIKEIVKEPVTSAILFTRPRRFGKSLALSMLKYFFEISDEDRAPLFQNTLIYEEKDIFSSYFGAFPVIHLNFKNASGEDKESLLKKTARFIGEEFKRHSYLLASDKISEKEKEEYQRIIDQEADEGELSSSLYSLTRFLHAHHGKRVIVLIDEYDTPIRYAYENGYYGEVIGFFKSLYGEALKGNPHVYYAILTGILQVGKESIFSGLNNLSVNTVLDESMSEGFGFTEEEVEKMLCYYDMEDKIGQFREWYDGYLFGKTRIYNPLSVISAIKKGGRMEPYWSNTSEQGSLRALLSKESVDVSLVSSIMMNKRLYSEVNLAISYLDLDSSTSYLPSYLLATGYLTVEEELPYGDYALRIPNKEIESVFEREIVSRYMPRDYFSFPEELKTAFLKADENKIASLLEKGILKGLSYYDFGSEKAYQMMVYSVLSIILKGYRVRTEVNAGYGRSDIIAIPLDKSNPGMILEIKATPKPISSKRLASSSLSALRQVEEKDYVDEFANSNITKIILYGLSFAGKSVSVSTKTMNLPPEE